MTPPATWRIYYRRGVALDSADWRWDDTPAEGVLLVVEKRGDAVTLHMGADHYQLEPDGSIVTRDTRTLLSMIGREQMSTIKFGWYVGATEMAAVVARAKAEFGV